ncbi:MAG: glycosyltransferase family 2 protein [Candidatus Omnitrophica bacterium]|nr:glycosyltransferase family 2 protein [Candidatus Omnitrophota bacterium]
MVNLTVVILAKNEEKNMKDCLESVAGWADEIIVVDDESIDRTAEIARKYAHKVITKKMDIQGRFRNWAYSLAKHLWVLSLDADERVTPELKNEISQLFENGSELEKFTGFQIPRRNFIGKYWIRYGGEYPAAQLRLFRKDKFKYAEEKVHARAFLDGKARPLKGDYIHYSWDDFSDFLTKINRQTTWEAEKWISAGRKISMVHGFWRVIDRFPRRFFRKKGYKDGFVGFMIAFFDSLYQLMAYAKYREMKGVYPK